VIMDREIYDGLGRILSYPGPIFRKNLEICWAHAAVANRAAAAFLWDLLEETRGMSTPDLQELYTRTFDLNPVCALDVGWHLYGEAYERGRFLVRMREMLRQVGIAEGTELPDHLTAVLPALGRLAPEEAGAFAAAYVLPALRRMLEGLAGKDNPYEKALAAARLLLEGRVQAPAGAVEEEIHA